MTEEEILAKKREWYDWRSSRGTSVYRNRVQAELQHIVEKLISYETLSKPHAEIISSIALALAFVQELEYLDNSENVLEEPEYDRSSWFSRTSTS